MRPRVSKERVDAVRAFNRFYTQKIGVLSESLLHSGHSLVEARIVFELANHGKHTAKKLQGDLSVDGGYLSRILKSFEKKGLLEKTPCPQDGRQKWLSLTPKGMALYDGLNQKSHEGISHMLSGLPRTQQTRLERAMGEVTALLGGGEPPQKPFVIRQHRAGDAGWITYRHGLLYAQEYAFDASFEALVGEIMAAFLRNHDPSRERVWIAEQQGQPVGSVMLVKASEHTAKLRLLLVEAEARGLGLGKALVAECLAFAKQAGYRKNDPFGPRAS